MVRGSRGLRRVRCAVSGDADMPLPFRTFLRRSLLLTRSRAFFSRFSLLVFALLYPVHTSGAFYISGSALWAEAQNFLADLFHPSVRAAAADDTDIGLGLIQALSDPGTCFMCMVVSGLVRFIHVAGSAAFAVVTAPLLVVMVAGFLLVHTVTITRHFLSGGRTPWNATIVPFVWFGISLVLLGALHQGSGAGIFGGIFNGLLAPFLSLSMSAGEVAMDSMVGSFSHSPGSPLALSLQKFFHIREILVVGQLDLAEQHYGALSPDSPESQMAHSLTRLLMSVHMVCLLGMGRGMVYLTNLTSLGTLMGWVSVLIGVILFVAFFIFFFVAHARFIDPLVRFATLLLFAPLVLATLPFQALRRTTLAPVLKAFGYCGVSFLVMGIIYGLITYFLLRSFAFSVDITLSHLDVEKLFAVFGSRQYSLADSQTGFNTVTHVHAGGSPTGGPSVPDMSGPTLLVVSLLLCHALLQSMAAFAAGVVSYDLHQDMGQVAQTAVEGAAVAAVGTVVGVLPSLWGAARASLPTAKGAVGGAVRRFRGG